jgi:hypothetical protein
MVDRASLVLCTAQPGTGTADKLDLLRVLGRERFAEQDTWSRSGRVFDAAARMSQSCGAGWPAGAMSSSWMPSGPSNGSTSMPNEDRRVMLERLGLSRVAGRR